MYGGSNPPGTSNLESGIKNSGFFIVYVNAYNSYGCYDNHSDTITVTDNNSISNYLLSDNWVYPNPAQNRINLDFNLTNYDDVNISITDVYGRLIKSVESTVKENTVIINTRDISSGIYIIKVKGKIVNDSRKIVIKQKQ